MIIVGLKTCIFEKCKNIPNFNYNNEIKYCSTHKLTNMVDIKHLKCIFEDCKIQPIHKLLIDVLIKNNAIDDI